MIDLNPNYLDTIKRILAEYVPDCEVRAFGSRVKWTAKDYSDLDLAIIGKEKIDRKCLNRLEEAFENSALPVRVDVLDWWSISENFRKVIDEQCEIVQNGKTCVENRNLTFGKCAKLIRDGIQPDKMKSSHYIGLEHIGQGSLHLNDTGLADDVSSMKSVFRKGDILFGKLRPYFRKVVRTPFDGVCSTDIWVVRSIGDIDQGFLFYWMASQEFVNFSMQGSEGTKMPRAKWDHVSRHQIPFFNIDEQRSIAHILGALDDKIELNRRMNETLEAMPHALFKSWFIDFDPVIDNALATGKPIPEEFQERAAARESLGDARKPLPEEIRNLFPDEFEHTKEYGWIPKGWKIACLRDIGENPRRGIQVKDIESGIPYIGLQDMPQKCIALSSWGQADDVESTKFKFNRGEILFGKLRPYFHKVGIAPADGVCSTDILVIVPKSAEWFSLVLGHVTSVEFIEFVTGSSTGTRMPRTNWKDMGSYMIVVPTKSLAQILSDQTQCFINKILLNIDKSQELTRLRDTILPKLLSGEIRIPYVEKLANEAV